MGAAERKDKGRGGIVANMERGPIKVKARENMNDLGLKTQEDRSICKTYMQ